MSRRRGGDGRRWRHSHHRAHSGKRTTQQLVATIATLVMLILFWDQLSNGAAGCFTQMSQDNKALPASNGGTGGTEPESDEPEPPTVRFQLPTP